MVGGVVRALTWFAHRSDGVMYDDDFPNESARPSDRRTFSRLPGAELSEEQRQQAIEEIRRRPRIG